MEISCGRDVFEIFHQGPAVEIGVLLEKLDRLMMELSELRLRVEILEQDKETDK